MSDEVLVVTEQTQSIIETEGETLVVENETVSILTEGIQGPAGPPGTATLVTDEVPTGAINGSNATFTTAQNFKPASVKLRLNGIGQKRGAGFDYITLGNNTIQFATSPEIGDTILVDYEVN